ncbi:hypothetical protein EPA93_20110 [Ktedonosporobacter rubrisoli]|uniref:Sulfatase N-terminal domain-containing protein n=1 Tax=Ktedonosporobacter rubrisoli TaxID=2509675 RepID=A0A4P6JTE6_KTERU|nr:sulfatase-like hydrolase/transferase [Ktedonosporobacter rubrisoli]QBD78176.1 hypothetical protein EPA93_20110 [Ktedonosporobacter rubrisoli]
MSATSPNVVIIHTDQQRYDSLGCTGNDQAITPHIDSLAREGVLFKRHIAASTVCMPSRASLLTGRYPLASGVPTNGVALPRASYISKHPLNKGRDWSRVPLSHTPTLADILGANGYTTCSIGKLHLTPTQAPPALDYEETVATWNNGARDNWHGPYYGFQHVEMTLGHGENIKGHYRLWLQATHSAISEALQRGEHRKRLAFPEISDMYPGIIPLEAHPSTWIADRAIAYLNERTNDVSPFFLFVGFPDPHFPLTPPAELLALFTQNEVAPPQLDEREWSSKPASFTRLWQNSFFSTRSYSPAAIRMVRQYTQAMIYLIDQNVGRIVAALQQNKQYEQTILIFTSDHGDFLGDHGLIRKGLGCSDVLVHVPFILRLPPALSMSLPGEISMPMSNVDVVPTICALAKVPTPAGVQGQNILSLWQNTGRHCPLVCCYGSSPETTNISIYDERYRLTWYPVTREKEFYDHWHDPHELHNLASGNQVPAKAHILFLQLLELLAEYSHPVSARIAEF